MQKDTGSLGSMAFTAYNLNIDGATDIAHGLRDVGVNVIELRNKNDLYLNIDQIVNGKEITNSSKDAQVEFGTSRYVAQISPWDPQCLLYTDSLGRVFNVVVSGGSKGLINYWYQTCVTYSGWKAILFLPFLARILGNINAEVMATATGLGPGLLALIVGFILIPETSLSSLACARYVRGVPSVAAYVWCSSSDLSDHPRCLTLLILLMALFAPTENAVRKYLFVVGTCLVVILLCANLGSRAYRKIGLRYIGTQSPTKGIKCLPRIPGGILAFCTAVIAGLLIPYLGMSSVNRGREGDIHTEVPRRHVAVASIFIAGIYVLTDADFVKEALGFHLGHSFIMNMVVGGWWLMSTIASLAVCHRIENSATPSLDKNGRLRVEPFLKRDHLSPVGWCVPSIPNIVIDPTFKASSDLFGGYKFASDMVVVLAIGSASFMFYWNGLHLFQ
uniref:Uncharacterized protein n=1 Tax=Ditylum brightwellii TaxID=49249 RepID=A0A7S1ZXR3_9STRA|mmetsp:Transcript_4300/g.6551  ORF Transcript_4300/g.6551 Transcript_4300/m.6551 type:complete len:446 (+) Transcript_4300:984-2321(+)